MPSVMCHMQSPTKVLTSVVANRAAVSITRGVVVAVPVNCYAVCW